MTERHISTPDSHEAGRYEIRLTGHLDAHWTAWFDGLAVTHQGDGTTVISGQIADQSALHGVLQRVRDLGLPLISVIRDEPDQPNTAGAEAGNQSTKGK
jgi:hypothetical protein